jgi:PPOX class probable F420-dependent enzyme
VATVAGLESVRSARVVRLATVRPNGRPHLVPIVFALVDDTTLVFAVDQKPKRSADLQRLRNIEANPSVCVLVDSYADDWSTLWWVRLDGLAEVVRDEPRRSRLLLPLVAKYEQYRLDAPDGPIVAVRIESSRSWAADGRNVP